MSNAFERSIGTAPAYPISSRTFFHCSESMVRAVCVLIPFLCPQRFCDKYLLIYSRICFNIILSQIFDTFGNTLTGLYIIFDWCFVNLKTGVTSASFSKDWKIFWSMIWWFQICKRCNAISLVLNFKHLEGMSPKVPFLVLSTGN